MLHLAAAAAQNDIAHTALRYAVGWAVGFLMGTVVTRVLGRKLLREARAHSVLVRKIADRLDTRTDGGLRDVVEQLRILTKQLGGGTGTIGTDSYDPGRAAN